MQKRNYQKELDSVIDNIIKKGIRPKLLLHSCCAPCSSYVLEYLNQYFDITLYYYNPNISPKSEYDFRISELHRLVSEMGISVKIIDGDYEPEAFEEIAKGTLQCRVRHKKQVNFIRLQK